MEQTTSAAVAMTPNRIRVETALSRFPIHRLAKKGTISIDMLRLTQTGQTDYQWKVSFNAEYGQPGPLAYKLDTLIINRLIDEARRPLPEMIKLGSLSDICRQLDMSDSGVNRAHVKNALLQDASAFIAATIEYRQRDGTVCILEIADTRYGLVLTGKRLPDGTKADAVYIVLHPWFRNLQNQVELRPLDYDYLKALAEGSQRLYELLSFPMYGALINDRPRAKLIYSEYCLYAPQNRYYTFNQVKKQMYKVHLAHRESNYIAKVEYQEITDHEGISDWEIFYTPGSRAFQEYQAFALRKNAQQRRPVLPAPLQATSVIPVSSRLQQQTLGLELTGGMDEKTLAELTRRGVTEKKARELLAELSPGQEVMDQIEWTDSIIAKAPVGKFHNPPGLCVATIRDNITPPATFLSSRKRRLQEEAQQAKNAELGRSAQQELAYAEYQSQAIETYIAELPEPEYQQMLLEARRHLKRTYTTVTKAQLEELAANWVRAEIKNSGRVQVIGFEEFNGNTGDLASRSCSPTFDSYPARHRSQPER